MAAIKRFFQKRKLDIKFKTAGEGHKLTEDTRGKSACSSHVAYQPPQSEPSSEAKKAAEAALARMSQSKEDNKFAVTSSIKAQARREVEAEKKAVMKAENEAKVYSVNKEVHHEANALTSVEGVFFKCPLVGSVILPKSEMESYIEQFLFSQLPEEPEMTSALMVHTLNKDVEKVKACIDILSKYVDNILTHPAEEKYRKVRVNNKVFQEKVAPLRGTQEFMQAAGFLPTRMPGPNEVEEEYLVMEEEHANNIERLNNLKELLYTAEPIRPELDHNLKVYYPSDKVNRIEVPDSFYAIKPEELKKEQQRKQEAFERLGMLRTKEMREREQLRELRKYRYTLIRVRFPDGVILQGTFHAMDKLAVLLEFVRENLENDWMPFILSHQTGHKLDGETASLAELGLAPAAIVNFAWDPTLLEEMAGQGNSITQGPYLKAQIMEEIQSL